MNRSCGGVGIQIEEETVDTLTLQRILQFQGQGKNFSHCSGSLMLSRKWKHMLKLPEKNPTNH